MDIRCDNRGMLSVRSGCLLMAGLSMARGSSFLMSKSLLDGMGPLNLLGLRFLLAFAVLFLLFLKRTCRDVQRDPGVLAGSFVLGGVYFLCMAAELIGLQYTTSSTCSFLENSAIVIVPVIEAILLRRRPAPVIVISTLITFLGIGFIVLRSGGVVGVGLGEILCMAAALLYAVAIILTDRLSKKHDPMTLGILYVGIMGSMGIMASLCTESPHLPHSGSQWVLLLGLALLCTAFGFTMQPVAQKPISSETAGIIGALNPLTTAILGWLLLGEMLGASGILGAVLIISGILLPNLRVGSKSVCGNDAR